MVMGSVRDIRNFLKKMPYTVRVGNIPGGLSEFITIQAAINYCATQTPTAANRWMVQVWPGTYDETTVLNQSALSRMPITLPGIFISGTFVSDGMRLLIPIRMAYLSGKLTRPSTSRKAISGEATTAWR